MMSICHDDKLAKRWVLLQIRLSQIALSFDGLTFLNVIVPTMTNAFLSFYELK